MSANKEFAQQKNLKRNWRFLIACVVVIGVVLYFLLRS